VREAYEDGRIGQQAASLIGRALARTPVDEVLETDWVEHATETTVRRLRDELRLAVREAAGFGAMGASPGPQVLVSYPLGDGREQRSDGPNRQSSQSDEQNDPVDDAVLPAASCRTSGNPPRPVDDARWHGSLARRPGDAIARLARYGSVALGGWGPRVS